MEILGRVNVYLDLLRNENARLSNEIFNLPKYISNFPYFTGFPACALAKRYVFSLIFALMR